MRKTAERGFTLAEVLVSLLVMSIAVVGLSSVILSTMKMQNKTTESAVARAVAARVMDGTLKQAQRLPGFWEVNDKRIGDPDGAEIIDHTSYRYYILTNKVKKLIAGSGVEVYDNEMMRVTVIVRWGSEDGSPQPGSGKLEVSISRLANHRP